MKRLLSNTIRTGIWINQGGAFIIRITGKNEPVITKVKSGVESRVRFEGEGKMYSRFGNAFIDDQEKKQKRQQQQRRRFFKKIIGLVHDDDYLVLFGPGKAKMELNKALEKEPGIKTKVLGVETSDRMTQNQMKEFVRDFFAVELFSKQKRRVTPVGRVI